MSTGVKIWKLVTAHRQILNTQKQWHTVYYFPAQNFYPGHLAVFISLQCQSRTQSPLAFWSVDGRP